MTLCVEGLWYKMRQYEVEEKFVYICRELYSGVETRVVLNGGKSRWFAVEKGLRQGCTLLPLLFNIYLMGMAEELERANLGVKLEGCWCRTLRNADDVVLVADSGAELQAMLDVVEAYVSLWKTKLNSRKSKVMVVGKREAGVSGKIGEEIVEEVEEFKYLAVWVDKMIRGNVQLEMAKMAEDWIGRVTWMSRVNGQVEVERGRMVWKLLARPCMEYAAKVWWTGGQSACRKLESSPMIRV